VFERPGRSSFPLLTGPDAWWKHEIPESIRLMLWSVVEVRKDIYIYIYICINEKIYMYKVIYIYNIHIR